jgi:DNA invertase Pin-like site-specific DNA recombinase
MPRKSEVSAEPAPTAYSYIRFSHPDQAKGDSLRRQEEARDAWLARSGAVLDTSLSLQDKGVSGYTGTHRTNPDRHALAAFVQLVEKNRVARGSYLIVENLDRLSREDIQPALLLVLNLLQAGVRIVQLKPVEMVFDAKSDAMQVMMMVMELSRGHSESAMKSERVGAAWAELKRNAAKDKAPITKRTPAWLRVERGRFVVDEEKGATVRRVYRMAAQGHGLGAIAKLLNAEGVPPVGPADHWPRSYVAKLLSSRAPMGEYQPHTRRGGGPRRPEGPPIPGYFPAVITEEQWHAARAALASRRKQGGRPSPRLNLFTGMARDARDGGTLCQRDCGRKGSGRLLVSYRARNGAKGSLHVSFPLLVFEEAILKLLREIDTRELLPRSDGAADRVLTLAGRLADLEARIEQVKAQLVDGGDCAPLADALRTLDVKWAAAAEELAEAQRAAASPLSAAWGECTNLLAALKAAEDQADARGRLRGAMRRVIECIWCLFVPRGAQRLASVQVYFKGGARRDYVIHHRPATGGAVGSRRAEWRAKALAFVGERDLRKRQDAGRVEKALAGADLEALWVSLATDLAPGPVA